jgi:uncharacterized membrane protein YgaE (UPF0421/DUF939 family)
MIKGSHMLTRNALRIAVENTLVCLLGYLGGYHVTALFYAPSAALGGLWALISGIVVLQATRRETWSSAWLRVLGTFIGAVISAIYLFLLPFSPLGMAVTVGVTVLLCQFIGIPDHARLAALTVAVILVISSLHPEYNPLMNALLRFMESTIGTVLAVMVVVLWPEPARK